jgi:hypothetical protein
MRTFSSSGRGGGVPRLTEGNTLCGSAAFPHGVRQFLIKASQCLAIFFIPIGEQLAKKSSPRLRDGLNRAPPISRNDRFAHALVVGALAAGDQSEGLELGRLPTHC